MFIETLIIAIILGVIIGGNLRNLKDISLRHVELFILAFVLQTGLGYLSHQGVNWVKDYRGYIHIFSYLLLFAGLFINRQIPGIKIISLGVFLNFLVIAANQGFMPVEGQYLPAALLEELQSGLNGTHRLLTEETIFRWLADWIYCPLPYSNQMISVGDIVIDLGLFYLIILALKHRTKNYKLTNINWKL